MGIYVEHEIPAPIQRVWALTQTPSLHQRWDLRFTSITYLPRPNESAAQEFQYETRLGFGLRIHGTGTTQGETQCPDGTRASALIFRSSHVLSLIREGRGYWKYIPTNTGTRFVTAYDYTVRWGFLGKLLDRVLFRPLMAWATAWSFDSLAQWATHGTPPETSRRLAATNTLARVSLAAVWLYEGLFPKLLGPHPQELALSLGAGIPQPWVPFMIQLLGTLEVLLALFILTLWQKRWPVKISLLAMPPAALAAAFADPALVTAPFNALVTNGMVAALSAVVLILSTSIASAAHCHWTSHARRDSRRDSTPAPKTTATQATQKENEYALDL